MTHRMPVTLIAVLLLSFGVCVPSDKALAAGSASFAASPAARTVEIGERFTVDLLIDPNGESIDTARAFVRFPNDILIVENLALGSLFSRQSPGSGFDNDAGTISEGAFVPGGSVTESGVFATITFVSVGEGTAAIDIADDSRLISVGAEKGSGAYADASVTVLGSGDESSVSSAVAVSSITHPDQERWYRENAFVADWSTEDGSIVTQWRTAFDRDPASDPNEPRPSGDATITIADVEDGTLYFHVKGVLANGGYTETSHYRVRVDRTLPNPIEPTTMRVRYVEGEDSLIEFGTIDDTSGIDRYELSVNDGEPAVVTSPYVLRDLAPGDYFIEVMAVDRAGNERFGKTGLRVYVRGTELKEEDVAAREEEQKRIDSLEDSASETSPYPQAAKIFLGLAAILGIISAIFVLRRKMK